MKMRKALHPSKARKRRMTKYLVLLEELRSRLGEINSKLEHLIKNYRRFYFVTGTSPSIHREFDD